jgi:hypothetical protein
MRTTSRLKGEGYLTSTVSVILLGIPALKSASENKVMLLCLLLGMAASITGMALRWWSHRVEQRDKDRLEQKAEAGPRRQTAGAH